MPNDRPVFARLDRRRSAELIRLRRDHLTELDAAIGDADHGTNLDRGFTAVRQGAGRMRRRPRRSRCCLSAGTTLIRRVGGASGPLYGTAFRQMGKALDAAGHAGRVRARRSRPGCVAVAAAGQGRPGRQDHGGRAGPGLQGAGAGRTGRGGGAGGVRAGGARGRGGRARRRSRCRPARGGPAIWASAASGTRTRARPPRRSSWPRWRRWHPDEALGAGRAVRRSCDGRDRPRRRRSRRRSP